MSLDSYKLSNKGLLNPGFANLCDTFLQYAIRPTVRGNEKFNRDIIIKTVADVVGPDHPVDLKNYDKIILVDVVQVSFFS